MPPKKFYAVHRGREPGVYETWDDCEAQVKKFKNSMYKSFSTIEEATHFVETGESVDADDSGKNVVYVKGVARLSSKAVYSLYWPNDSSRNTSVEIEGEKKTQERAYVQGVVAAIVLDRQGEDTLIIKSASKATMSGFSTWWRTWKDNGWKTVDKTDVQNKDLYQRGLSLIEERPGQVEFVHVSARGSKEDELVLAIARMMLNEDQI